MAKKSKKEKSSQNNPPTLSGGVKINAEKVKVGGDVIGRDQTITKNQIPEQPESIDTSNNSIHSAWANGLFYLFVFVIVIGILAWIAGSLNPVTLGIVVIAGIITVPLIGVLQLYMDKQLTEKSFVKLLKLVIRQLPIISSITKSN